MQAWWDWSDAWIFIGVFAGIRVAFIWLATELFIGLIPDGDECPLCGDHTLPVARDGWWRILGARFRRSYCLGCQWEGVLRRGPTPPPAKPPTPPPSRTAESTRASSPAPR